MLEGPSEHREFAELCYSCLGRWERRMPSELFSVCSARAV
jgi:hypothetical protein